MTLVVATHNPGKLREIEAALSSALPGLRLRSLEDFPEIGEIAEPFETFEDNAVCKARALCDATGHCALADDSGLAVDSLGGFPGVSSARWAGPAATDAERNAALLGRLREQGIPESAWSACFLCVLALALPGGACHTFTGEVEGRLIPEPRGESGFGYDPIFLRPETGKTMAELTREEKNACSHRGLALAKLARAAPQLLAGYLRP